MLPWALKRIEQEGTPVEDPTRESDQFTDHPHLEKLLHCLERWDQNQVCMLETLGCYDLILSPVNAYPAYLHGAITDDDEAFSYTLTFSLTGWPTVVLPVTWTEDGLPIGVQIVAQPWKEELALKVAAYVEQVLGGWKKPPL
jgi:amidase